MQISTLIRNAVTPSSMVISYGAAIRSSMVQDALVFVSEPCSITTAKRWSLSPLCYKRETASGLWVVHGCVAQWPSDIMKPSLLLAAGPNTQASCLMFACRSKLRVSIPASYRFLIL